MIAGSITYSNSSFMAFFLPPFIVLGWLDISRMFLSKAVFLTVPIVAPPDLLLPMLKLPSLEKSLFD